MRNERHKLSYSVEYTTWLSMRMRCYNKKNSSYKHYGARGIGVCKRWRRFSNFYADMGKKPTPKHSLDRIDNNKGYSPDNCKWSTNEQQLKNRRNTARILGTPLNEWARILNIRPVTLYMRLKVYKWDELKTVTTPLTRVGGHVLKPFTQKEKDELNKFLAEKGYEARL